MLRVYFLLVSTTIYQNQDLLISGAVSETSRRLLTSESVVGGVCEEVKDKGNIFVKQNTISFDSFPPLWTVDKYLSIIAQPIFVVVVVVQFLVCFPRNLPETRHENQMNHCSGFA